MSNVVRVEKSLPLYCYKCGRYLETDYERKRGLCLLCLSPMIEQADED